MRAVAVKRPFSGEVQIDLLRVMEESGSGYFYYSLRRSIEWSQPKLLGGWSVSSGDVADHHPLGAFYRIASALYQTLSFVPGTAGSATRQ